MMCICAPSRSCSCCYSPSMLPREVFGVCEDREIFFKDVDELELLNLLKDVDELELLNQADIEHLPTAVALEQLPDISKYYRCSSVTCESPMHRVTPYYLDFDSLDLDRNNVEPLDALGHKRERSFLCLTDWRWMPETPLQKARREAQIDSLQSKNKSSKKLFIGKSPMSERPVTHTPDISAHSAMSVIEHTDSLCPFCSTAQSSGPSTVSSASSFESDLESVSSAASNDDRFPSDAQSGASCWYSTRFNDRSSRRNVIVSAEQNMSIPSVDGLCVAPDIGANHLLKSRFIEEVSHASCTPDFESPKEIQSRMLCFHCNDYGFENKTSEIRPRIETIASATEAALKLNSDPIEDDENSIAQQQ